MGRFGLPRQSPPESARSTGAGGGSGPLPSAGINGIAAGTSSSSASATGGLSAGAVSGATMPSTRPLTPGGRYPLGQVRASQPGPVRVPSSGPTSLPLHVSNIGSTQRPKSPAATPLAAEAQVPREAPRRTLPSSSLGASTRDSRGAEAASSAGGGSGSGAGLTAVISSALDYKRFLERRKQLIQAQVESAQQASASGSGAAREEGAEPRQSSGRTGSAGDGGDGAAAAPTAGGSSASAAGGRPSTAPNAVGGWTPGGTTGPVKASHNMAATTQAAGGDRPSTADATQPATTSSAASSSSAAGTPPLLPGDAGKHQQAHRQHREAAHDDQGDAAAQLLRRMQERQARAQTPTERRIQPGLGAADLNESGRLRGSSLPAGGARQACRSLGHSEQRWVDNEQVARGDLSPAPPVPSSALEAQTANMEGFGESGASGDMSSGRQKHRKLSEDGLLRDSGDGRISSLSGSSIEDYIVGKQIGQGAYATVFFGLHRETGKKVAIKIYEKYKLLDPQRRKSVRCEIRLMERMRHPNIVVFHDALDTPKQIHIIMDFVGGGSLHHFLKKRPGRRLDDAMAKRLTYQVAQGIKYLHDRHIVHRDVKLENLLLDEAGTVKIIDFGFSTILPPGKRLKIFCGTPSYMAPEIVARKEYPGFCADIWAIGVLLYALLCGSFPFRGQNDRDLYRKIVRGVYHVPQHATEGARNILGRMLTPDMARRPGIDEMLADAWFSSHRDDLYTATKGSCTGYQPNTSTSSTATTAAPSSSAGQSARENFSGDTTGASGGAAAMAAFGSFASGNASASRAAGGGAAHAVGHGTGAGGSSSGSLAGAAPVPASATEAAEKMRASSEQAKGIAAARRSRDEDHQGHATGETGGAAVVDAWGAAASGNRGSAPQDGEGAGPSPLSGGNGAGRGSNTAAGAQEEAGELPSRHSEAIAKLERLGYPREEIVRQLQDESSHLCKLYHRFLKALTAWDHKK